MKVYEALANAFVKEGVTTVFGLLGGQHHWWACMSQRPEVQIIDAREEGAALTMADGWARATGKVGVCSFHCGPGIARTTTSLIESTRARTPIVVLTRRDDDHLHQYLDVARLVAATEAGYIEITNPSKAELSVQQAFYRAKLESKPIVLCVPVEVDASECDSEGDDYQPSATLLPQRQRFQPASELLNEAVRIISESKRPVVLLGAGAMESQTKEASDRIAKRIGALIATSLVAKGTLSESEYHTGISGLYSTRTAMQLFEEADCVIAIGASLNEHTIAGGLLYRNARIIHINAAPHVLMGNKQGAHFYLQGDAAVTTRELDNLLEKKGIAKEGYRTEAVRKSLQGAGQDLEKFEIEPGTIDPREAVKVMDERLPSNVSLAYGVGHAAHFVVLGMKKPRRNMNVALGFTCIGQVLANGIGFGVGSREPIVVVEGDGGAMQNIQELDTAARLGIKLLYVVLNDQGYGAEYQSVKAKGLDPKICMVRSPDFVGAARAFGFKNGRVARTLQDLAAGIDEFMASSGPMILDVRISRNVISIPLRRTLYAKDV